MNTQRLLVQALAEAAPKLGVQHHAFSADWVQVITTPQGQRHFIMGYKWPLNTVGSSMLADDKYATSVVLAHAGVPCVEHYLFLRRDFTDETLDLDKLLTELRIAAARIGYPVVVKNNHGVGGEGVYLVETERKLNFRVTQMFSKYRGVAISALFDAPYEYRLVVLNRQVLLVFKKVRAKVVGDGVHTLAELALAPQGPMAHIADHKKDAWLASIEDAAHQIIPVGQTAALEWRHNLAYGAQPEVITPENPVYASLADIAIRATQAMSLNFCTVDILQSQSGELKVLEVNSGVSVEKFAEVMGEEGLKTAKKIYQQALKALVQTKA